MCTAYAILDMDDYESKCHDRLRQYYSLRKYHRQAERAAALAAKLKKIKSAITGHFDEV